MQNKEPVVAELKPQPIPPVASTGLRAQACGDCHLLNFGGFATPERNLIFSLNDFDETLPATPPLSRRHRQRRAPLLDRSDDVGDERPSVPPGEGGEAMGNFAVSYADQAERDHAALRSAVRAGRVTVFREA